MLKYICRNVSFLPGRRNWAPRCQVWRSWSTEHDRLHSRSTGLILWPTSEVRGAWLTVLGLSFWLAWIYRRSCAKMVEILRAWHPLLHTSNVAPITYHFTLRTSARQPVGPSARQPVSPSARRNKRLLWQICRFLRYPKLGAVGVDGFGAPVNDNRCHLHLQTEMRMIIDCVGEWEWLSLSNGER